MGKRNRKLPLWACKLALCESRLKDLLEELEDIPNTTLSDKKLSSLGIEIHELDFETGATCRSAHPFFVPRADDKCRIDNTTRHPDNPDQDTFTDYRQLRKAGINVKMGLQTHLAIAFQDYAYDLAGHCQTLKEWRHFSERLFSDRKFHSSKRDRYSFHVNHGAQSIRHRRCHQQVWMESNDEPVEDRPMLAELIVLVSWILSSMRVQRKLSSYWARKRLVSSHHTFPTLLISFQPRARARVLYGYWDGTLKVQMSKHQEFDVPDYVDRMDALLKWAWPQTCGLTTRIMPLPTITEEEDENEIQVEDVKTCGLLAECEKWHWRKRWQSLVTITRRQKPTPVVEIHECEFKL